MSALLAFMLGVLMLIGFAMLAATVVVFVVLLVLGFLDSLDRRKEQR